MNQELVEWESEEKEMMKENMELDEIREKSTKEKVSFVDEYAYVMKKSRYTSRCVFYSSTRVGIYHVRTSRCWMWSELPSCWHPATGITNRPNPSRPEDLNPEII